MPAASEALRAARRVSARPVLLLVALVLGLGLSARPAAAQVACVEPNVEVFDEESEQWVCADPQDISCGPDAEPAYFGGWYCRDLEPEPYRADPDQPDISCPEGVIHYDDEAGEWYCGEACEVCEEQRRQCKEVLQRGKRDCIARGRVVALTACTPSEGAPAVNWRGESISIDDASITCEELRRQDPTTGDLVTVQGECTGPAIEECVKGYMQSHPGETVGSSIGGKAGVKVGASGKAGIPLVAEGQVSTEAYAEVSGQESESRSWGAGKGIQQACVEAVSALENRTCPSCAEDCP
jgi:hypothetical protein